MGQILVSRRFPTYKVQERVPAAASSAVLRCSTLVRQSWQYFMPLHHAQTVPGLPCVSRQSMRSLMAASTFRCGHKCLGDVFIEVGGQLWRYSIRTPSSPALGGIVRMFVLVVRYLTPDLARPHPSQGNSPICNSISLLS